MTTAEMHRKAFRIAYNYLTKYASLIAQRHDAETWQEAIDAMPPCSAQLDSTPLILDLMEVCYNELVRIDNNHA